jgi:hypothetical protein
MDPVYEAAIKRLDELRLELKMLNDFIEMYRRTRQILGLDQQRTPDTKQEQITELTSHKRLVVKMKKAASPTRGNPKPAVVIRKAVSILDEHKCPMSRRQLHSALCERGLVVKGADPIKALGTMLWRSDALIQIGGHGYWIKSRPYEPGNYHPTISAPLAHAHRTE